MSIVVQGVIHGKTIELKENPGVADGQEVEVTVHLAPRADLGRRDPAVRRHAAGIPGVDEAFEEIQRERKARLE